MFKPVFLALPVMLAAAMPAMPALAQTGAPAGVPSTMDSTAAPASPESADVRSLELSTGAQTLTGGFGKWRDLTLRGAYGAGAHVFQGELSHHDRFGQSGTFVGVSDTYTFDSDWHASLALGAGDGAFYLPKFRV
ncbi:MAG: YaiO family outer membrane beta-barrel protein, partial [Polaromonas sp.]|nr:YaiO family outer membrane beta-barrel protein [Polaromonas sp.]